MLFSHSFFYESKNLVLYSLFVVGRSYKIGRQKSCNETPLQVNDKSEGDNGVKRDRTSVRL